MNDQPKPPTHWERPDNWHPEPAAGKWTTTSTGIAWAKSGTVISPDHPDNLNLVILHNSALATEKDKYENATDNLYRDIKRLNQQLSAERKSEGKLRVLLATELERRQAAEQQLAAERKLVSDAAAQILFKQLELDEVLKGQRIYGDWGTAIVVTDEQLAKVKEGKQ
jgi:hypothetical protein